MAAYTTGTTAKLGAGGQFDDGIAGATIAVMDLCYLDETQTPNKWELVDADNAQTTTRQYGIALNAAIEDEHIRIARRGKITCVGSDFVAAVAFYGGLTGGDLVPIADLATGDYPVYVGMAESTTVIHVNPHTAGVALG